MALGNRSLLPQQMQRLRSVEWQAGVRREREGVGDRWF